jgi:hypothetical protein
MSKGQVRQYVKNSFQREMNSDLIYRGFNIQVKKVVLINSGRNSYEGTINVLVNGEPDTVSIDVKVDGRDCAWQEVPFPYSFLVKHGLKNLGGLGKEILQNLQ